MLKESNLSFFGLSSRLVAVSGWADFIRHQSLPVTGIIHLAAAVPDPVTQPDSAIFGAKTRFLDDAVLALATEWDVPVVYTSACSLYRHDSELPLPEEDAINVSPKIAASPYLQAKLRGERLFLQGGRSSVLRIGAPLGQGVSDYSAFGTFIRSAVTRGRIEVWGTGAREQNYLDVSDIAEAVKRALLTEPVGLVNVANRSPTSMLELATYVSENIDGAKVLVGSKNDPAEGQKARFDSRRASELLGWQPKVSIRRVVSCFLAPEGY